MTANTPHTLFLGCLLIALGSCSPDALPTDVLSTENEALATSLEDTNWQLIQLKVLGGFVFTADEPSKYTLNFRSDNRLTGTSDCNRLSGQWFQEGFSLRFDPFASTRTLCPPGSLHNNLALYLKDTSSYALRDGHMILSTDAEGIEMEFESR